MGQREHVLDGLAWAGITEQARVARIAAMLVRENGNRHTQTHIKDTIRNTAPPYGRAKYIFEELYGRVIAAPEGKEKVRIGSEIERQYVIYSERKERHDEWERWQEYRSRRSTRLNYAYAAAFGRPPYEPSRKCPIKWDWSMGYEHENYKLKCDWDEAERKRDKGDVCLGLTHQDGYVVCLVDSVNGVGCCHIAVRLKSGPIVRTHLREDCENLVEAAVSLGGPRVRAAIAKGKRVKTDWVGRRSFIHHDGSDHQEPKVEEVPWIALRRFERANRKSWETLFETERVIVHGTEERLDRSAESDHTDPAADWR